MIIVTGGAGFIGSNLVKALNKMGRNDIIVVDDLSDGRKMRNLSDCDIFDYVDKDDFFMMLDNFDELSEEHDINDDIEVMFHLGACSDTTEWDGKMMMRNNYEYSKVLLHFCQNHGIPFIYASSASVYGANTTFAEQLENEQPLNMYAYSKWQFDQYVRCQPNEAPQSQVVGLRYFNVYGPREAHKDHMASVAFHFNNQLKKNGTIRLFEGCDGYGDGEQVRDFVYVSDVVAVNIWLWQNPEVSGIFNVGSGQAQTFNDVAKAVIHWHKKGELAYIPFPDHLKGNYQSFTQADLTQLRNAGYQAPFKSVAEGVKAYLDTLAAAS